MSDLYLGLDETLILVQPSLALYLHYSLTLAPMSIISSLGLTLF